MSMAFRTCPECRWNKVGHYCGKQMTLNGFECINYDKKEKKEINKINNNIKGDDNNMKKIITKTSEEARREKEQEQEREKLTCPECNNYDPKNLIEDDNNDDNDFNNKYRCTKCGCEWLCEKGLTGPVEPLCIQWVSVNMESQGTCPNCGNLVVDGYSRIDRTCPLCGIELIWRR